MTGKELHSQLPLSVVCTVPIHERSYVLKLMFGEAFQERYLGRVWWWKLRNGVRKAAKDHAMMVAGIHSSQVKSVTAKGAFGIPNWVSGEVDVPLHPEILNSRSVRSDFKKISRK